MKFAFVTMVFACALLRCAPSGQPNVPPTAIDTGVCVIDTVSKDLLAGMGLPQALEDAAIKCLGSATAANVTQVQNLWGSHLAAIERARDGGVRD